ncbi:xylulokinase [Staphylococcus agnetis]|uniref:xylulokinase n=2 Tax=Staphylococcus agnetis TaxID=985762 RepID=UPI003B97FD02
MKKRKCTSKDVEYLENQQTNRWITSGAITVGIELGSTQIKTVAVGPNYQPLASGVYKWENQYRDGYWTYDLDDVWIGIQESYRLMREQVKQQYGGTLRKINALGISGMMHGYLAFNEDDELLVPFRTWRNNYANFASRLLSYQFQVNVPERWSIALFEQAIMNKEPHAHHVAKLMTLAGYVHWQLTGEHVSGIGDASGMFPIDTEKQYYRADLMDRYDRLLVEEGYEQKIETMLPHILKAGDCAGTLTEAGAKRIDPSGCLEAGIPLCPPEGDAATGMVATNSIQPRTGNVSVGTSIFSMFVLDAPMSRPHPEVDIVSTPDGYDVAMIHANNGTSDLDAWMHLFEEVLTTMGVSVESSTLYERLFATLSKADANAGGLLNYNYVSSEFITDVKQGTPTFLRHRDSQFNLANFMKSHIYSSFVTLKMGVARLAEAEDLAFDCITAHGGLFQSPTVAYDLAAALDVPVQVRSTAHRGGAWGIALLASYMSETNKTSLSHFLDYNVFRNTKVEKVEPTEAHIKAFNDYALQFLKGLRGQREAYKLFEQ